MRGNAPDAPGAMLNFHSFRASQCNAIVPLFFVIFTRPELSASVINSVISSERQASLSIIIVCDGRRRSRLNICIFVQRRIFAHRVEVQSFVFIAIFVRSRLIPVCDNEPAKQIMNQSGEGQ